MPRAIILIAYILIVGNLSNGRIPTQTIRGVVIDAGTRVTLPGANIILAGSNIGTIANCDGNFLLKDIPVGRYNLLVSYKLEF